MAGKGGVEFCTWATSLGLLTAFRAVFSSITRCTYGGSWGLDRLRASRCCWCVVVRLTYGDHTALWPRMKYIEKNASVHAYMYMLRALSQPNDHFVMLVLDPRQRTQLEAMLIFQRDAPCLRRLARAPRTRKQPHPRQGYFFLLIVFCVI